MRRATSARQLQCRAAATAREVTSTRATCQTRRCARRGRAGAPRASIGGVGGERFDGPWRDDDENVLGEQVDVQKSRSQGVRVWVLTSPQRSTFVAAEAEVKASTSEVWEAVRSYDSYDSFFQNVERSRGNGNVVSLDLALQSVYWRASARARLAIQEQEDWKEISFNQIEGDFQSLRGRWVVESRGKRTILRLEMEVEDKAYLPRAISDHIIHQGIPSNLKQLAKKVELTALTGFAYDTSSPYQYLGVSEVPLPSAPARGDVAAAAGERGVSVDEGVTNEGVTTEGVKVHLRKLDNDRYIHSRVIASVDITADKEKVWKTLTDYDNLPTILPNLVHSKAIRTKYLQQGRLKLRQIAFKEFMYLKFRAEAVLDVLEKPYNEIQFQLSNGTFDKLQGKFVLHSCYDEEQKEVRGMTSLVYALEIRIPKGIQTFAVSPLVEKFAFEDVANNVALLKAHIENISEEEESGCDYIRPSTSALSSDFEVLKLELKRTFGEANRTMPKKGEFRSAGRFDLEKACYAHGGFRVVAEKLGWKLQYKRKPRDYWQNFDNLRSEVTDFIQGHNLPPKDFPSRRTFIEYDRMDIVRAYTKWGGAAEVAGQMGLRTSSTKSQSSLDFDFYDHKD